MYVALTMNALNYYPHKLEFETVRHEDAVRRHNWSPGYYGTSDDLVPGHCLGEIAAGDCAEPRTPAEPRQASPDADLEMADA
ncbi:hypothetical protein [Luteibacter sp.]|uniref:hypothetical protein n=1 Tax=Luteibacter sp. TaxID=1886636 RepID=UPI002F3F2825